MKMEGTPEQQKNPEIKIDELMKVLNEVVWEDLHVFSYNGTDYVLLLDLPGEPDPKHGGAQLFPSTHVPGGWDVYILKTLSEKQKMRRLFHEVLEGDLRKQGYNYAAAHAITLMEEDKQFGPRK